MACNIEFQGGDFTVAAGQTFVVDVVPPKGGGLQFLHMVYAGSDPVKAPPYTFEVKPGVQNLHVFYAPSSADQQGKTFTLVEVCGGAQQPLAMNKFDFSDPHFGMQIEGA